MTDAKVRVGVEGAAEFKRTLSGINAALRTNAAELKKVGVQFADSEDAGAGLSAELQVLEKRMELLRQKEAAERQELEKVTLKYGENSAQAERRKKALTDVETEIIKLNRRLPELREELERGAGGADELADGLDSGAAAAGELGTVLSGAAVLSGIREFAGLLRESADASIDFESAITGVFKTVDGTDEELAAISAGIKEMAGEIPASATELAGVAEAAGQLGIAVEDILDFTRVMTMLGTTTDMSAETAATALARFANVSGTDPKDYERLASVIVALGNNLATTESEITEMGQRLASAGTLAGLSEPNILALAAAMSSVGIEAEAGGTAMTQTMNSIGAAVDTGGEKLNAMARLAGMTADEFSAKWKGEPIEALQAFIGGLGELDDESESATEVLNELGMSGIRQSNMLRSLALAVDVLSGAVELSDVAWTENIALSEEANLRYGTTESKLQLLANASERLAAAYGETLTPAMGTMAEIATKGENKLAEMLETTPELGNAITILGSGMSVFALGTVATTAMQCEKLVAILNALRLAALSNPYTAIAAVVAMAGAAAVTSEKGQEVLSRLAGTAETLTEKYGNLAEVQGRLSELEAEQNKLAEQGYDAHTLLTEGYERANKVTAERAERCIELNREITELKAAEAALLDISGEAEAAGSNTIQGYVSGLEGESEKAYAKTAEIAEGVLISWNGALGIHSPSTEFAEAAEHSAEGYLAGWKEKAAEIYATLKESGIEAIGAFGDGAASETAAVVEDVRRDMDAAWKAAQINFAAGEIKFSALQKALKNTYSVGNISEEVYYKKLKALRDRYLSEDDSEWGSVTLELYNFSEKQLKEYRDGVDGFVDDYEDAMKEMADATKDALDDIQDEYDDLAKDRDKLTERLFGGDLYETVKLNFSDGSSGEYFRLTDWGKDIEELKEYQGILEGLKGRGINAGVFEEVLGMDVDEAARFGRELLTLSDEEWEKYNGLWEEKRKVAAEIAESFYKDQMSALENEYSDALREGLDGLSDISTMVGENIVGGLIEGMEAEEDNLRRKMQEIADAIEDELRVSLDMHSPSRRLEDLASLAGEGLIVGFETKLEDFRNLIDRAVPSDLSVNYGRETGGKRDSNMLSALGTLFGGNTPAGDLTVVFQVDGLDFARATLPNFRRAAAESPVAVGDF